VNLSVCCRVILETDPATIAGRVAMRGADAELPLTEQVWLPASLGLSTRVVGIAHAPTT
jgi:hypothetical protein